MLQNCIEWEILYPQKIKILATYPRITSLSDKNWNNLKIVLADKFSVQACHACEVNDHCDTDRRMLGTKYLERKFPTTHIAVKTCGSSEKEASCYMRNWWPCTPQAKNLPATRQLYVLDNKNDTFYSPPCGMTVNMLAAALIASFQWCRNGFHTTWQKYKI